MAENRRQFTREFKLEAVRMITSGERKVDDLARDLGVQSATLRDWLKSAEGRTGLAKGDVFQGNREAGKQGREIRELSCKRGASASARKQVAQLMTRTGTPRAEARPAIFELI